MGGQFPSSSGAVQNIDNEHLHKKGAPQKIYNASLNKKKSLAEMTMYGHLYL